MFKLHRKIISTAKDLMKICYKSTSTTQVFINGKSCEVPSYFTVLQACRHEGVTVPTFCYHGRLSIAGNCRMCLVEIEGMMKPQVSCALQVMKGMKIRTNSSLTYKAQEGVLEFILANHPLDCPICDQGGECDLQDLSMRFGNDRTRFTEIHFKGKRAQEDKDMGPFIRTVMTRCIQCTRCIRFASQICGLDVLGTTGRGEEMLVGSYVQKFFLSELSGNIIDLCPVGALTSIPYLFKGRPWEIYKTKSIDVTDATGTNIIINWRNDRLMRVLPRENHEVNQEWLSDKGRWAVDSMEMQRLVCPMIKMNNCLIEVEWDHVLKDLANTIKISDKKNIVAVAGPQTSVETLVVAKDLLNKLCCENTFIERSLYFTKSKTDIRSAYLLNIKMCDVAMADKILFVGTNPRFEAPILNAWIRDAFINNECDIYVAGPECEYNYHVQYIGNNVKCISNLDEIKSAKYPLIFVGCVNVDTPAIMNEVYKLASCLKAPKGWNVVNIIPRDASWAGALEVGWQPGGYAALKTLNPSMIISVGADDVFYDCNPPCDCPVVYVGFQGDRGAQLANYILPGSCYLETGGLYMNMEGRPQEALPAVTPPGKARADWKIFRALAEYMGVQLPYADKLSLNCRIAEISPIFNCLETFQPREFTSITESMLEKGHGNVDCNLRVDLKLLKDYYCSDIFSANSPSMCKATRAADDHARSDYAQI